MLNPLNQLLKCFNGGVHTFEVRSLLSLTYEKMCQSKAKTAKITTETRNC